MVEIGETTRKMIDMMFDNGFRRGQAYVIEFAFYGDGGGLEKVRTELVGRGYKEDASQTGEMLILTHPTILDYDHLGKSLLDMKMLSEKFGVTFDGWSADAHQETHG
jgi:hypothetical protein